MKIAAVEREIAAYLIDLEANIMPNFLWDSDLIWIVFIVGECREGSFLSWSPSSAISLVKNTCESAPDQRKIFRWREKLSSESPKDQRIQRIKGSKGSKSKVWVQKRSKVLIKIQDPLDFAYCIVTTPPPPTHHKLFKHFQRSYHHVLYLFGNLSWPLTWIQTQFMLLIPLRNVLIIQDTKLENS